MGALTALALTYNKSVKKSHSLLVALTVIMMNAFAVWLAQWSEARNHLLEPDFTAALRKKVLCGQTAYRKAFNAWAITFSVAGVALQVVAAWVDFWNLDGTAADWFSALSVYLAGAMPTLIFLSMEDGKEREREEKRDATRSLQFHVGTIARIDKER